MSIIYFRNPGTLPIEAITTLGISVKEGDSPIGRFGTGLKYTIAGALRLGEELSIQTGGKTYYFYSRRTNVRGKDFQIVCMKILDGNAEPEMRELGFTSDLGKHWQPWMYIRELWSNMKDEGGTHGYLTEKEANLPEGETRILISGRVLEAAYANLKYFILPEGLTPIFENHSLQLFPKVNPSEDTIFFQGIRIGAFPHSYPYSVNFKEQVELTEDRVTAHPLSLAARLRYTLMNSEEDSLIKGWFTSKDQSLLAAHSIASPWEMEERAKSILKNLWDEKPFSLNEPTRELANSMFKPDDSATEFELSKAEQEKFSRALAFIRKLGCDHDIEWKFVDPKDNQTYGFVRSGQVYICKAAFDNGTQFLAQTMMEEYLHHIKGFGDYTPALQDFLFAKVLALAEEVHGVL